VAFRRGLRNATEGVPYSPHGAHEPMEIYNFVHGTLAWIATIACLWPVNAPLLALAFKVQNGPKPIDMENDEYWMRAFAGSFVLALVTAAFVFIDFLLVEAELPAGPTHLVVFVGYVPAAVWVLALFFAMEDLLNGLSLLVIYLFMPILVLFLLNLVIGFWNPLLAYAHGWLKAPT
jgi:hypothetical protein